MSSRVCGRSIAHRKLAMEHGDEEVCELETCCICLDSLCSAPVVALLQEGSGGQRACRHFYHGRCAEKLSQNVCPVCREPFASLSAPFGSEDLAAAGAVRVMAGAQRLTGLSEDEDECTVPTRTVVELLAAVFPIRQRALEAAVQELAVTGSPRTSRLLTSGRRSGQDGVIAAQGLVRVLARCRVPLHMHGRPMTAPYDAPLTRYSLATRLARRVRWLALKSAGAVGTGIFAGCCGAVVGITLGAIAAIPQEQLRQRSYRFVYDVLEYVVHADTRRWMPSWVVCAVCSLWELGLL
jgi:hypothetical protein